MIIAVMGISIAVNAALCPSVTFVPLLLETVLSIDLEAVKLSLQLLTLFSEHIGAGKIEAQFANGCPNRCPSFSVKGPAGKRVDAFDAASAAAGPEFANAIPRTGKGISSWLETWPGGRD